MDTVLPFPLRRNLDLIEAEVCEARFALRRPELHSPDALRRHCEVLWRFGDEDDRLDALKMADALDRITPADMRAEAPRFIGFLLIFGAAVYGLLAL